MIPAVVALGGDEKQVLLNKVCQDPRVRLYFQNNGLWDFDDFQVYFQAHWETWDYDPATKGIRWRSKEESKDVVANAKRKAEELKEAKEAAAKRARAAITKVVMLTNLVGADDVDEDLEEETADEAKKYGKLKRCTIKELKGLPDDRAVRIFP